MRQLDDILAINLLHVFTEYAENPALQIAGSEYSYADLYYRAGHIATLISQNAVQASKPVAILGSKTFMTYAGICGALLSSKAYMPLNLKFPLSRNKKMLKLSGAEVIVADTDARDMLHGLLSDSKNSFIVLLESDVSGWEKDFPDHQFFEVKTLAVDNPPEIKAKVDDVAYLLFTSGTTGIPKGVPVSNRNVTSYLHHVMNKWEFREDDRFSQTFDLTFDLSVHDMFVCWLSGACLCVPAEESPFKMLSYIREMNISVWFSVPSVAVLMDRMRLLKENALDILRLSFFCGEPLPASIADKWQNACSGKHLENLYGPSEATIAITSYEWNEENREQMNGVACIGKIFESQAFCLMDENGHKTNTGKGELCLGGSQVINAYLNDPALSEKYFISFDDEPERKWYRTGDLVELKKGNLFFLGRLDSEVKISGYRVNLFEVDAVIRKYTSAEHLASVLDDRKTPHIVTFLERGIDKDEAYIIRKCKEELPWYMIPEVIIFVDEMPLNVNGKIDRNRLKEMLYGY